MICQISEGGEAEEKLGNRIINLENLEQFIKANLSCGVCKSNCGLQLWEDGPIEGWASQIGIECLNRKCKSYNVFSTSPTCLPSADNKNPKVKQVNR